MSMSHGYIPPRKNLKVQFGQVSIGDNRFITWLFKLEDNIEFRTGPYSVYACLDSCRLPIRIEFAVAKRKSH